MYYIPINSGFINFQDLMGFKRGRVIMTANDKMTLAIKMKAIRKARNMTQVQLSIAMGYSPSMTDKYESFTRGITEAALVAFRRETGTEDVPLTDGEVAAFKKDVLCPWNDMLNFGDIEKAVELQPMIAYRVEWSCDADMQVLYELFSIKYNCVIGKREKCDSILESLRKREKDFTDEQKYWYYRYLGFLKHSDWMYKPAVALYMKAEEIGDRYNLNDTALYYNIGNCLSYMGFYYLAIVYLEKIQLDSFELFAIRQGLTTQKLLAKCYSKLGRTAKALEMLKNYLEYLLSEKKSDRFRIGGAYFDIGRVYRDAGDFEKALENFDMVKTYYDKKSEAYIAYLCYRAFFLREYNKNDEVMECLDKGSSLVVKGTLWYEWLNAIKHSLSLDKQSSVDYIVWTAIPKLNDHGCHWLVMELHKLLSKHYDKIRKYKPAFMHKNEAMSIYVRLMKGDLSL